MRGALRTRAGGLKMLEQSVPLGKQLERVQSTMDAFSETRLSAEMILKFTDVMRPCYTSFVKASDVPHGNYDTGITNPLALFRLSRPITRVCETTKKATDVFVSNKILDFYTVHCLILDNKRRSTEDLQSWR
jgi:hypothetical protein